MARVMKPPTDGYDSTDTGGDWYDGPPPPPGLYKGEVKKLMLSKVTQGERKGDLRILVVCEISEGKYKGAGVTKWLNFGEKGDAWINNFLRSLTDGSEAQYKGIREAFWKVGYTVDEMDAKKRLPIIKIGKKTNPIGMATSFMTKIREERAEIVRFVSPVTEGEDDDDYDEDEALAAVDELVEENSSALPEGTTAEDLGYEMPAEDETSEGDLAAVIEGGEDDDPWSIG